MDRQYQFALRFFATERENDLTLGSLKAAESSGLAGLTGPWERGSLP